MQNLAPDWVRARVLAVQMLVLQGSIALGSAIWGIVAQRRGLDAAFLFAGIGTAATSLLGLRYRLPDADSHLSVWNHWRMPVPAKESEPDLDEGPVLVIVEYLVDVGRGGGVRPGHSPVRAGAAPRRRERLGHLPGHGDAGSLSRDVPRAVLGRAPAAARAPDGRRSRPPGKDHKLGARRAQGAAPDLREEAGGGPRHLRSTPCFPHSIATIS